MKCLTSESNSSACPLILPQEIVDLIIDAVAYSFFLDEDITRALLLCSLVRKPFHHAARRHLFSNIRFVMDDYANERATNLRRVLTHKSNEDLLLRVRSVALVPERYDGPLNQRILRSRKEGQGGLSNLHKTLDPTAETSSEERGLVELLRILSNTKLENLSICYHQGGLIA
ncbi:hypothetical protein CPB84DRAFT_414903 [Gymnopilus junonius]|uniref:F-box domain-containing protein n=1 Tax=Gymnopilus junonius TaxID=109634 RepID=A0A9P5TFY0_GYMJU|nr:hypothetical protein CPB84DRAFT_414903 [Gymnopilus junonius]